MTLAEYLFDLNLGIDEMLFHETFQTRGVLHPLRMAGATGLGFVFAGVSISLMATGRFYPGQGFAVLTFLNGFIACVGYLLGVRPKSDPFAQTDGDAPALRYGRRSLGTCVKGNERKRKLAAIEPRSTLQSFHIGRNQETEVP